MKAIFLCGPTASGKSELAINLAKHIDLEIINVDSALIYKDLNIGSAKPSLQELSLVPHHLIDIISPLENYSVKEFLDSALKLITQIKERGKTPLLVGGTMMYFNALINGLNDLPEANSELRLQLYQELETTGNLALHKKLQLFDIKSANKINPNDTQRLIRALEVYYISNTPLSELIIKNHTPGLKSQDYIPLAIMPSNRKLLHNRINQRLLQMLATGLIEEVISLREKYPSLSKEHNSMRSLGYRQVWEYLEHKINYNELVATAQAATRQLAKRQITWLRQLPVIPLDDLELNQSNLLTISLNKINQFFCSDK